MTDFERRLALVERALSRSLDVGRKAKNETAALRIVVQTLLSNFIDSEEPLGWLDDLEQVAFSNAYVVTDTSNFEPADCHCIDSLSMEIAEEDRAAIQSQIREIFNPLKNAQLAKLEAVE